ncbi:MAG: carbohydrate-binding protein [Flavobacteriaceae bacterium]|nr:carbohydrate-binding protein [Flavobacteriaceae bacterium]
MKNLYNVISKLSVLLILFFGVFANAQFLTTSGKQILDKNGNPIILRGVGLGGWMLQEPYMMNFVGGADNQQQFRSKLESLIGEANTQEFYNKWLDNFVTKTDIDSLASWGFNSVRLPMHYNLFTLPTEQEEAGQNTWLDKGFEMVDDLLEWCEDNQLYLILDLHAAPGGQGYDQGISDYDTSKPSLWESDANKQKMVALWDKLAERYKNEEWIGGYDILNEPNWNLSGSEIKNLYVQVTNAIRSHDTNHIIFIEGNWFANDYTGLTPPWDDNMVYSFHKYWNVNTQSTIQWVLDMRDQYNVPLWMGESGENSNVWFKEAISLFEDNDIGWAWWPWKRIETTVSSFSITSNSNYNAVVEYFKGNASAPSVSAAYQGLLEIAEASKIQNCQYRKDVIDAMLRQPNSEELKPFANHSIPGVVHATHYDMGSQGLAYYDTEYGNYSGSGGTTTWNRGWVFRNDGVDISTSNSGGSNSNGYSVGYVRDREWIKYTVNVLQDGYYDIKSTYAADDSGGKIQFEMNDNIITAALSLNSTGSFSNFETITTETPYLFSGEYQLKIRVLGDKEFNLESFTFNLSSNQSPAFKIIGGVINSNDKQVSLTFNKSILPSSIDKNEFTLLVNGEEIEIADAAMVSNNNVLVLTLTDYLSFYDQITVSASSGTLISSSNDSLLGFSNFEIVNLLDKINLIPGKIEAERFDDQIGIGVEDTTDIGLGTNIKDLHPGDFASYEIDIREGGNYMVECRVATIRDSVSFSLELRNGETMEFYTSISFSNTGGWQNWQTISKELDLEPGKFELVFRPMDNEFNLNWLNFTLINDTNRKSIPGIIEAEDFTLQEGLAVLSNSDIDAGSGLGYLNSGDFAIYDVRVEQQGTYNLQNRVATTYNGAQYNLDLISSDGKTYTISQVKPNNTGGWNNWQTVEQQVVVPKGNYDLKMTSIESEVNINWYNFIFESNNMQPTTLSGKIEAEDFFSHYGTNTENCNDIGGGKNISYLNPGDFTNYLVHVPNTGYFTIKARVSGYDESRFNLSLSSDNNPDEILHEFTTPKTNGWQNWQDTEGITILIKEGDYKLNFNVLEGTFNVNWFEFVHDENGGIQIPGKLQAEDYWDESGLNIENCYDVGGGQNLSYMNQGDYAKYLVHVGESGHYKIKARVSSSYSGGLFNLVLSDDSSDDTILNNFQVPNTGGWQNWQTVEKDFELIQGSYELTMNVIGNEFNLNWIEFDLIGPLSNSIFSSQEISLFPNPSAGNIFVKSEFPIDTIEIFSINGKQIDRLLIDNKTNFSIKPKLPKGLYLLKFNKHSIKKLLIQ